MLAHFAGSAGSCHNFSFKLIRRETILLRHARTARASRTARQAYISLRALFASVSMTVSRLGATCAQSCCDAEIGWVNTALYKMMQYYLDVSGMGRSRLHSRKRVYILYFEPNLRDQPNTESSTFGLMYGNRCMSLTNNLQQ